MKSKAGFLLCAVTALCITAVSSFGVKALDNMPCISLQGGYASESSTTSVTVSIDTEIDIAAYSIALYYDPSLIEFTDAYCKSGYGTFYSGNRSEDSVTLIWSDSHNRKMKGVLFTVSFKTKNGSAGNKTPIEVGYSVLGSESAGEIPFRTENCEINILNEYTWGDANGDERLSVADAVKLNQYTSQPKKFRLSENQIINCDTDGNGIVNSKDCENIMKQLIKLRRT